MTDAMIHTLRLRGEGATRLARVAATRLPDALARSLSDVADCRVESVRVAIDVDPRADDDTIAVLWAAAVRAELMRIALSRGVTATARPTARPSVAGVGGSAALSTAHALAIARAWLDRPAPRDPLPRDVIASVAAAVDGTGAQHRAHPSAAALTIAAQLAAALCDGPRTGLTAVSHANGDVAAPPTPAVGQGLSEDADSALGQRRGSGGGAPPAHSSRPGAETVDAAAATLTAIADLMEDGGSLSPATVTRAAGLALLYPWLADHCRAATDLHPGLDEPTVRIHALAAIVDPADTSLLEDPLITLLAGAAAPPRSTARLPLAQDVSVLAERVLRSFASLLPGFATSSPTFVRDEWIRRIGAIDADRDPMRLTAVTHPLDVALVRLPYPVGLFSLPWSPPVMVRFRP